MTVKNIERLTACAVTLMKEAQANQAGALLVALLGCVAVIVWLALRMAGG